MKSWLQGLSELSISHQPSLDISEIIQEESLNISVPFPEQDSNKLLVIHQGVLFFYSREDHTIRYLVLSEYKKKFNRNEPCDFQDLLTVDFTVQQLVVQDKLLAIIGVSSVQVVVLPFSLKSPISNICFIGDEYYHQDCHITKAEWHPLGSSHLLIQSTDGFLRLFNVASDPHKPEQSFCLSTTKLGKNVYGPEISDFEPVSFTFGVSKKSHAWGSMTVYSLCKNGDVHIVCPVLPFTSQLSNSMIYQLKEETQTWAKNATQYWASQFVQDLLDQTSDLESTNFTYPKGCKKLEIGVQKIPLNHSQVDDITCVANGIVGLLLSSSDKIHCYVAPPPTPLWIISDIKEPMLDLVHYETLDLGVEHIQLVNKQDTIYAVYEHGIIALTCKWTVDITNFPETIVRPILACHSPLLGFDTLSDVFLGHFYLILTTDGLYGDPIPIQFDQQIIHKKQTLSKFDPFQLPSSMEKFPTQPKRLGSTSITTETLKQVSQCAVDTRKDVQTIMIAMSSLQEHIEKQILENQKLKTTCLQMKDKVKSSSSQLLYRIKSIQSKDAKLRKKMDLVLEILLDLTQPDLSKEESEWIHSLDAKAQSIKSLEARVRDIQATFQTVPQLVTSSLGSDQEKRINEALKQEYLLLSDAVSKLESLTL